MIRALRAVAAAALAAGCAASPFQSSVHSVSTFPNYVPLGFSAFASAGPAVELRGPLPGGASPEAVAAALRLPAFYAQAPFRPVPAGSPGQRIVLAFGATGGDTTALCEGPGAAGAETPGRLEVAAAYCVGSRAASVGRLSDARPLTPGDPAFTAALRTLFTEMAPTRDPNRETSSDRCILPPC